MKQQKDLYDYSQVSTSGKPGIEPFQSKKNDLFYYHVNDKNGKAILYSQSYTNILSRDKGILSVKKNNKNPSRYKILAHSSGGSFFILKAGNHQEIARSKVYESGEDIEQEIQYLLNISFDSDTKKTLTRRNKKQKTTNKDSLTEFPSLKHAFRIDIYNEKDTNSMVGKIEYMLTSEKATFKNLDFSVIQDFITLHTGMPIPKKKKKSKPIKKQVKKVTIKKKEVSQKAFQPQPRKQDSPLIAFDKMYITSEDSQTSTNVLNRKSAFSINLKLPKNYKIDSKQNFKFKLTAQSMGNGTNIKIGEKWQLLSPEKDLVNLSFSGNRLTSGVYRIKSQMQHFDIKNDDLNVKKYLPLEGDCLVYIN